MYVDHVNAAGAFMQVVDVLSNKQEAALPGTLEPCQSQMGVVWMNRVCKQLSAARVIERVDQAGISRETLGSRDVLDVDLGPDAIRIAKRVQPGLARNACAAKDNYIFKPHACASVFCRYEDRAPESNRRHVALPPQNRGRRLAAAANR
jgi:hypothetical protein